MGMEAREPSTRRTANTDEDFKSFDPSSRRRGTPRCAWKWYFQPGLKTNQSGYVYRKE